MALKWFKSITSRKASSKAVPASENASQDKTENYQIPLIKFDPSVVTKGVERAVLESIMAAPPLSNLSKDQVVAVWSAAMDGVRRGGDRAATYQGILTLFPEMPKNVAKSCTNHLHNAAKSMMNRERDIKLGLVEAYWVCSGAPCTNSRHPNDEEKWQVEVHKSLEGKKFNLRDGVLIGNRRVWPGDDYGCRCYFRSVLRGWNDK